MIKSYTRGPSYTEQFLNPCRNYRTNRLLRQPTDEMTVALRQLKVLMQLIKEMMDAKSPLLAISSSTKQQQICFKKEASQKDES